MTKCVFIPFVLLMIADSATALDVAAENLPTLLVFPPYLHSYGIRKATQAKLKLFLGLRARFDDPQGIVAVKMTSRDDPGNEGDDDEVTVYGVNSGRHQIIYNTSMYGIASFGEKGSEEGMFLNPKGITADIEGNVYVADAGNHRVAHLFNPKSHLQWAQTFGEKGDGIGQLNSPEGVSLGAKGRIYVADTGNDRIQVFNAEGACVKTIGGGSSGLFRKPTQLAVCESGMRWTYFRENALFVIDSSRARVQKIGREGNRIACLSNWPDKGSRYEYLSLDFYCQLYLTDFNTGRIIKLDRNLRPLATFGHHGRGDREFLQPRGISIWRRYGQVFIAEKHGAQYYWVGTDAQTVSINGREGKTRTLELFAQEPSFLTLSAVKRTSDTLRIVRKRIGAGKNRIPFLIPVAISSLADFLVRIEPTYSSYTYFAKDFLGLVRPKE